jgi:hypothetical protein
MAKRFGLVVVLVVAWSSLGAQRPAPQASIEGVWRAVEQTINGQTLSGQNLGVGFHIYTKGGYVAAVRESGTPPRPAVPNDGTATAAQILAAYGPFVAQFSSYKVSGDRLTTQILVAKNPDNMGQSGDQRFRVEGNTLTLMPYETPPPGARTIVLKMVRVE